MIILSIYIVCPPFSIWDFGRCVAWPGQAALLRWVGDHTGVNREFVDAIAKKHRAPKNKQTKTQVVSVILFIFAYIFES